MKVHEHTCDNCGDVKQIYLHEDESPEELDGCVCDREVSKTSSAISPDDLLKFKS
jgi:hypothetical protein